MLVKSINIMINGLIKARSCLVKDDTVNVAQMDKLSEAYAELGY